MAGAASQAGDADSSRAPGLTSGLQGSVNVHRVALFLVPQWQCISSFVFYIVFYIHILLSIRQVCNGFYPVILLNIRILIPMPNIVEWYKVILMWYCQCNCERVDRGVGTPLAPLPPLPLLPFSEQYALSTRKDFLFFLPSCFYPNFLHSVLLFPLLPSPAPYLSLPLTLSTPSTVSSNLADILTMMEDRSCWCWRSRFIKVWGTVHEDASICLVLVELNCRNLIIIYTILGQMLKSWNFSISVFFLTF